MVKMEKTIITTVFLCYLALTNASTATSKYSDDDSEQSGDFDFDVNSFKTQQLPDSSGTSSDEIDVSKAFSNNQQRQHKQDTKSSNGGQRSQTKSRQQNRKADLNDDVNDFVDLIPKAEVKAKFEEYYRNDMDIQHIFEYMHGKEFLELRKNILELSDVKETLQYLNKNGLNVKSVLRKLDNRLGISKIRSTQMLSNSQQHQSFGVYLLIIV